MRTAQHTNHTMQAGSIMHMCASSTVRNAHYQQAAHLPRSPPCAATCNPLAMLSTYFHA